MSPPAAHAVLAHEPDDRLALKAAGGDRLALDVLLRRHQLLVYRVCRRLCPAEADAADATQEALVTVARRIDRFDGRSAFTTWLYRVTTNACLDELRRRRRQPVPTDAELDERGGSPDPLQPDPGEVTANRLALDAALASLPPEFRVAVVLRDVAGLDYAEIGDVLGIPPGTVRSRIARGRAHLARQLALGEDGNPDHVHRRPTTSTAAAHLADADHLQP